MFRLLAAEPAPDWGQLAWLGGLALSMLVGGFVVYKWFLVPERTDRKAAEARVEACEERYRTMVERYGDKTHDAIDVLGRSAEIVRGLTERSGGTRRGG